MQDLFCFLQIFFIFNKNIAGTGDSALTFILKYNTINNTVII